MRDRRNIGPRTTAVLGHRDGHLPLRKILLGTKPPRFLAGQNVTHGIPLPSDFKQKKPCNFGYLLGKCWPVRTYIKYICANYMFRTTLETLRYPAPPPIKSHCEILNTYSPSPKHHPSASLHGHRLAAWAAMLILVWAAALAFGPLSEAGWEMADANGEIVGALTRPTDMGFFIGFSRGDLTGL